MADQEHDGDLDDARAVITLLKEHTEELRRKGVPVEDFGELTTGGGRRPMTPRDQPSGASATQSFSGRQSRAGSSSQPSSGPA